MAHPFAKLLWIGLMPDVESCDIEHMHCLMPTRTARPVSLYYCMCIIGDAESMKRLTAQILKEKNKVYPGPFSSAI